MKKILLAVPFIALAFAATFSGMKPIEAKAEGEEASTVTEEAVSAEGQATSKFDINSVTIDGKTIEQWKADLKDESTRNAALMAILMSLVPTFLFIIKWLTDRSLISKAKKVQEDAFVALDKINGLRKEQEDKVFGYIASLEKNAALLQDKLEKAQYEAQMTHEMLETVMKTDPKLVAADAYKEAKKLVEEKYGKGKEE